MAEISDGVLPFRERILVLLGFDFPDLGALDNPKVDFVILTQDKHY